MGGCELILSGTEKEHFGALVNTIMHDRPNFSVAFGNSHTVDFGQPVSYAVCTLTDCSYVREASAYFIRKEKEPLWTLRRFHNVHHPFPQYVNKQHTHTHTEVMFHKFVSRIICIDVIRLSQTRDVDYPNINSLSDPAKLYAILNLAILLYCILTLHKVNINSMLVGMRSLSEKKISSLKLHGRIKWSN